jgi:hypothetical protein
MKRRGLFWLLLAGLLVTLGWLYLTKDTRGLLWTAEFHGRYALPWNSDSAKGHYLTVLLVPSGNYSNQSFLFYEQVSGRLVYTYDVDYGWKVTGIADVDSQTYRIVLARQTSETEKNKEGTYQIRVLDLEILEKRQREVFATPANVRGIFSAACHLSREGKVMAYLSGGEKRPFELIVRDLPGETVRCRIPFPSDALSQIAISDDGSRVAWGNYLNDMADIPNGTIPIYDTTSGQIVLTISNYPGCAQALQFVGNDWLQFVVSHYVPDTVNRIPGGKQLKYTHLMQHLRDPARRVETSSGADLASFRNGLLAKGDGWDIALITSTGAKTMSLLEHSAERLDLHPSEPWVITSGMGPRKDWATLGDEVLAKLGVNYRIRNIIQHSPVVAIYDHETNHQVWKRQCPFDTNAVAGFQLVKEHILATFWIEPKVRSRIDVWDLQPTSLPYRIAIGLAAAQALGLLILFVLKGRALLSRRRFRV